MANLFFLKKNLIKTNKFIKIILIICSFYTLYRYLFFNNIKICMCTIGKEENLYIREFISHYEKYGVDKIFIYDNNEIMGEHFESVIMDYLNDGFVEIINFRGKIRSQLRAYQDCLDRNYNKYNWLIFYDMDEFIYLKGYSSIKPYLNRKIFDKCQTIQLNLLFHTDNGNLYYNNRPLMERFKETMIEKNETFKSIIRGNIKVPVKDIHNLNMNLTSCNSFGKNNKREKFSGILTNKTDFKFYYIDHFCFKSTEEFIHKINRGSAHAGKILKKKMIKIGWYFERNKITLEKIGLIENYTHLNLSDYRKQIVLSHI